jgi:cytochrome c oxidase subunit IV
MNKKIKIEYKIKEQLYVVSNWRYLIDSFSKEQITMKILMLKMQFKKQNN